MKIGEKNAIPCDVTSFQFPNYQRRIILVLSSPAQHWKASCSNISNATGVALERGWRGKKKKKEGWALFGAEAAQGPVLERICSQAPASLALRLLFCVSLFQCVWLWIEKDCCSQKLLWVLIQNILKMREGFNLIQLHLNIPFSPQPALSNTLV